MAARGSPLLGTFRQLKNGNPIFPRWSPQCLHVPSFRPGPCPYAVGQRRDLLPGESENDVRTAIVADRAADSAVGSDIAALQGDLSVVYFAFGIQLVSENPIPNSRNEWPPLGWWFPLRSSHSRGRTSLSALKLVHDLCGPKCRSSFAPPRTAQVER